jgi:hypothetical protein
LLTCQSPTIIDNSTNNFTITATDLASVASPGTMTINSIEKIGGANDAIFTGFLDVSSNTFKIEGGHVSVV